MLSIISEDVVLQYFEDVRCWILRNSEGVFGDFLESSSIESDTSEGVCVSMEGNDVSSGKLNKRVQKFLKLVSNKKKKDQKSEAEVVGISASDKANFFFAVGQTYQTFKRVGHFDVLDQAIDRINKRDQ